MTTEQTHESFIPTRHAGRSAVDARAFASCPTAVVIEDDNDVRALLVQTLESAGYATDACAEAIEGVETVLATSPDLVTVDLDLPGDDGISVIRRIRAASTTTPHIVVISGQHDETDKILAFTAGADDYVTKPFRLRELRARFDAVTRRVTQRP